MKEIEARLNNWKSSLCTEIDVGGLYTRKPIAHKWKAPWRSILLREAVSWRLHELLSQSNHLHQSDQILGARILLRAAFETLAMLIYLNQMTREVLSGNLDFHEFSTKTTRLLLGSRDESTNHESINILSILRKADKRYPGLESWYGTLCETAHPNYEGLLAGYSSSQEEIYITKFHSRWFTLYNGSHSSAINSCIVIFDHEYNDEWPDAFEKLEEWIESKNTNLELTKPTQG